MLVNFIQRSYRVASLIFITVKNTDIFLAAIKVNIDLDKYEGHAERINITLPQRLLTRSDGYVKHSADYASRSAFLAEAARRVLRSSK